MGDEETGGRERFGKIARFSREVVGRPLRWYQAAEVEAWVLHEFKVQGSRYKEEAMSEGVWTVVKVVPTVDMQGWVPVWRLTEVLRRVWPEGGWRREGSAAMVAGNARGGFFSGQRHT